MNEFRRLFREVAKTDYIDDQIFSSQIAEKIFEKASEQGISLCNERNGITINAVKQYKNSVVCDVKIITD